MGPMPTSRFFLPRGWPWIASALLVMLAALAAQSVFHTLVGRNASTSLHTILEMSSVLTAGLVVAVGMEAWRRERSSEALAIVAMAIAVALLEFGHMAGYRGMPDFFTPNDYDKPIRFWLAARSAEALGLLWLAFAPRWTTKAPWAREATVGATLLIVAGIYAVSLFPPAWMPPLFDPAVGLLPLKVTAEYCLVAAYAVAAVGLWRAASKRPGDARLAALTIAAAILTLGEIYFTRYNQFNDVYNLLGHMHKVVAHAFIYYGLFLAAIREPFTALQRSEARLAEANAHLLAIDHHKDEFLSVLSHELRTPLNFITGFASTLEDEVQGPLNAPQRVAVGKILFGAERMLTMVDDLLDVARIQAGKITLGLEPTPVAALVDDVVTALGPLAQQKGLTLTGELDALPPVVLDRQRITQVLLNLVNNAIKFTPEGGRIAIRAVRTAERVRLTVTDTGRGIAPADLSRAFHRFTQLDMSATREAGGTGLGLAIAMALVEAHQGAIGLDSPGLDQGTSAWFELPINGPVAPAP
ncbi:Non-motile and phage-resistance protein [compost metagenome]